MGCPTCGTYELTLSSQPISIAPYISLPPFPALFPEKVTDLQDHQLMAALLVLLLLLAVPLTAFTTTDVYYVTAHDAAGYEQSCPPHQICHNLSCYRPLTLSLQSQIVYITDMYRILSVKAVFSF